MSDKIEEPEPTHDNRAAGDRLHQACSALAARKGWAVQITRKDGSTFLASSGTGVGAAVWNMQNRKWAVQHKRELITNGFPARVVPVLFANPLVQNDQALRARSDS